jgi:hypothetical protein
MLSSQYNVGKSENDTHIYSLDRRDYHLCPCHPCAGYVRRVTHVEIADTIG